MAKANKTRYALLGFLSMGSSSGYDIKKAMEQSTDHFWREGDGSIYPILKQLLDEGMVSCQLSNTETNKPKKVYRLTEDGQHELQDWLEEEPTYFQRRNELALKIFFGWNVDSAIIINHLKKFRDKVQISLEKYRETEKKFTTTQLTSDKLHRFASLKGGIIYAEASIKWC